jgi:hypothetical protein
MCVCDRIYRKRIDSVGLLIVNMMDHPKLVGGIPTPLKNMSSSAGMMTFPTEWKVIKFHGSSHHQPDHHHIAIVVGLYQINHY